ncbi:DUF397 domain-containing protein [Nocardia terpenica]|uniref:DUF397 domain-containing protein n=1 Tax=Nocardia terpenica TaxID=455432 RepID=UPI002FE3FB32
MTPTGGVWRKARRSGNSGNCVEVSFSDGRVSVRDSKYLRDPNNNPTTQPIITVAAAQWITFLKLITGQPTATDHSALEINTAVDGNVTLSGDDGVALVYTPAEWEAFVAGVHAGEFDPEASAAA